MASTKSTLNTLESIGSFVPTGPSLNLQKADVTCNGGSDGTVTATFGGGDPPYKIKIDGGSFMTATSPTQFTGLTAGPHTITVKDDDDRQTSKTITIGQPAALSLSLQKTDVLCNGGNDGTVTATFSGGTGPYQIKIDGGSFATATSPKQFTGLIAGSHTVMLKDANNCQTSQSITIGQPTPLSLSLQKTDVLCNGGADGTVTATFSGGTAPYQVKIDGGSFAAATSPKQFTGLTAGSHTVMLKDANNCQTSQSITIGQPAALSLSLQKTDVLCNGGADGTVTATFSGGAGPFQIKIDGGSFTTETSPKTFAGLTAGSHTVTLKDANNCATSQSITVGQPAALLLSLQKTDATCNGGADGTVTAAFSGGTGPYQVKIDGGSFAAATSPKQFTGLTAGSHTVTLKDANNCQTSQSITIGHPTALSLSLQKTDVLCNGGADGTVTAAFSGGGGPYQIKIDGGSFTTETSPKTFTGLTAGSHTVTLKDAGNCTTSQSITVGQPAALSLSLQKTDVLCNGGADGTVTATFSGGTGPYQVKIDGGSFATATSPKQFTGLIAGSHTVTLKDANNCQTSQSITVGQPAALSLSLTKTDVTCAASLSGMVAAAFSGGAGPYQIKIDSGLFAAATSPKTFTGLAGGQHTVTLKDANDCTVSQSITVIEPVCSADLALTKSVNNSAPRIGDTIVFTITVTNNGPGKASNVKVEDVLPAGLAYVSATASQGSYNSGTGVWTVGALNVSQSVTLTLTVKALIACDGVVNTARITASDSPDPNPANNQASVTLGTPPGPGLGLPPTSEISDQKAGSVLIYNFYTSSVAQSSQDTRINITNISQTSPVAVHMFFVDGATCSVADSYICLTPNQTSSFLASDVDPGTTGYLVAVAMDCNTGCPIYFNCLIGDAFVKLSSGHQANLGAEAVSALTTNPAVCDENSNLATLNFNGASYGRLPRVLAIDGLGSRADGNDTQLVINRIGGNLATGASTLTNIFGILYNDVETPLSFTFNPNVCQFRGGLNNNFPRTAPRIETFIPAGRTGWMKFYSQNDQAILGAALNFNPNSTTSSGAFNQGHNLHKLTLTSGATLVVPIIPPPCC